MFLRSKFTFACVFKTTVYSYVKFYDHNVQSFVFLRLQFRVTCVFKIAV